MNETKQAILARLRARQQNASPPAAEPLPIPSGDDSRTARIQRFTRLLQAVRAEVFHSSAGQWPRLLQQLCAERGVQRLLYAPDGPLGPALERAWDDKRRDTALVTLDGTIEAWKGDLFSAVDAAVTSVRAGIASTGTLVLWPTAAEPRSWSLVPPLHVAILPAERIHADFEQLIEQEKWRDGMPTNALLISGPSKTADIEQTLSYGIHGPVQLLVMIVE